MKLIFLSVFCCFLVSQFNGAGKDIEFLFPLLINILIESYKLVCYYSNWAYNQEKPHNYYVEDIPPEQCTHLLYAFTGVNDKTWELSILDKSHNVDHG